MIFHAPAGRDVIVPGLRLVARIPSNMANDSCTLKPPGYRGAKGQRKNRGTEGESEKERQRAESRTRHVHATCVGYVSRKRPKNRIRPGSTT